MTKYDERKQMNVGVKKQLEEKFNGKVFQTVIRTNIQLAKAQEAGKDIFPAQQEIRARVESMVRLYGMLGGVTYAEPFHQKEVGLVDDLLAIPVKSI